MTAFEVLQYTAQLLNAINGAEQQIKLGNAKLANLSEEEQKHIKNKKFYEKANAKAKATIATELLEWYN